MPQGHQLFICVVTNNIVIILALGTGALGLRLHLLCDLGNSLNLAKPHFPHLRNEAVIPSLRVARRLNELMNSGRSHWLEKVRTQEVFTVLMCYSAALRVRTSLMPGRAAKVTFQFTKSRKWASCTAMCDSWDEGAAWWWLTKPPRSVRLTQMVLLEFHETRSELWEQMSHVFDHVSLLNILFCLTGVVSKFCFTLSWSFLGKGQFTSGHLGTIL